MHIYIAPLLLTLNVPLRIGKCTPGWEPLVYFVIKRAKLAFLFTWVKSSLTVSVVELSFIYCVVPLC